MFAGLTAELVGRYMTGKDRASACTVSRGVCDAMIKVSAENPIFNKYKQYMQKCARCQWMANVPLSYQLWLSEHTVHRRVLLREKSPAHTCARALSYAIVAGKCHDIFTCYHTFVRVSAGACKRLKHAAA